MTKKYIIIFFLLAITSNIFAQDKVETTDILTEESKPRFFQSLSVGVDIAGPIIRALGSQGDYQAFVQMNIRGKFLPVVELGYGTANKDDYYTKVKYNAKAPFGRIGCDFNLLKNKQDNYRLTIGLRYGLTHFNYNTSTPDSTKTVFTDTSGKCTLHWAEVVLGVDAKVWGPLHMGWTVRYRRKLGCSYNDCDPLYAPGYGNATQSARWMGLYTIGIQI